MPVYFTKARGADDVLDGALPRFTLAEMGEHGFLALNVDRSALVAHWLQGRTLQCAGLTLQRLALQLLLLLFTITTRFTTWQKLIWLISAWYEIASG